MKLVFVPVSFRLAPEHIQGVIVSMVSKFVLYCLWDTSRRQKYGWFIVGQQVDSTHPTTRGAVPLHCVPLKHKCHTITYAGVNMGLWYAFKKQTNKSNSLTFQYQRSQVCFYQVGTYAEWECVRVCVPPPPPPPPQLSLLSLSLSHTFLRSPSGTYAYTNTQEYHKHAHT